MNVKKITAVAALAIAAGMLAACSAPSSLPSYEAIGFNGKASAEGAVTLQTVTFVPMILAGDPVIRTKGGENATASIEATANFTNGTWQINGSWRDGFVKFKFQGWAYETVLANEACGPGLPCSGSAPLIAQTAPSEHGRSAISGGCANFFSYYTSTNSRYPGTGIAEITLCDNGPGNGFSGDVWATSPDTVAVVVVNTRDGCIYSCTRSDASPYVGYSAGGTMSSNSKISVRVSQSGVAPTATADPIPWVTAS